MRKATLYLLPALSLCILVAASPFLLGWISRSWSEDWSTIGDIGQAYGAASAFLSTFAFLGIAGSMLLQARESAANRAQLVRNQQFSLLRDAQDDPATYGPITGHDVAGLGPDKTRKLIQAAR